MLCPSHSSLLYHPMNSCWELRTQKIVVCNFLHSSVTSCFADPDIHLNPCICLSVKGHESLTACNATKHSLALVFAEECLWRYIVTAKAANILRTRSFRNYLMLVADRISRDRSNVFDLQLDVQNSCLFTYNTFIKILYMFRALLCSSSGGLLRNCIYAASGIVTLCRCLSCAPVKKELNSFITGAQDSDLQTVTIPEAAHIQLWRRPPEDEQGNARNM
jgi:hypothetical protein